MTPVTTTRTTTSRSRTDVAPALAILALGAFVLGVSCKSKSAPASASEPAPVVSTAASAAASPSVAWVENDYAAALARARAEKKLLFVDAWATWCHTCRAMRAFVLTPETLPRDGFVFLAVDTERPETAAACAKLPLTVLPTFFVVDPRDERIVARWEGGASSTQLRAFFDDAAAVAATDAGALEPYRVALRDADRAEAEGRHADAAARYDEALAKAPADWARRPDVLVLRIGALARAKDHAACVDLARKEHVRTGRSSSATDFATIALDCEDKSGGRDATLESAIEAHIAPLTTDESAPLSADDRSDAYRLVWELRERAGDPAGAKRVAADRLAMLERAAAKVGDPEIASAFDGARLETLLYLDRPADAVTLFVQREKELPTDYNGSYRLAKALLAADRANDALAAVDRALANAYGARKGQILGFRADVLLKLGRAAEAKAAVAAQLATYQGLPEGQRHPALEKATADRLAKM